MATVNAELVLVKRFYALSQRYETRPAIARRNTLPTLARFLHSKDRDIRKLSLEAISLLAEHPENVDLLGENESIVNGIFHIYQEAQYDDPELCELSSKTLDALAGSLPGEDPRRAEVLRRAAEDTQSAVTPLRRTTPVDSPPASSERRQQQQTTASSKQQRSGEEESSVDVDDDNNNDVTPAASGTSPSTRYASGLIGRVDDSALRSTQGNGARTLILDIPAFTVRSGGEEIEDLLQSAKGVISYTLNAAIHQVRVFVSSSSAGKALQAALSSAGYTNMVISEERAAASEPMPDGDAPGAPSFYDAEQRKPSYLQGMKSFASSLMSAVMVYGTPQSNSLATRVQQQRDVNNGTERDAQAHKLGRALAKWW